MASSLEFESANYGKFQLSGKLLPLNPYVKVAIGWNHHRGDNFLARMHREAGDQLRAANKLVLWKSIFDKALPSSFLRSRILQFSVWCGVLQPTSKLHHHHCRLRRRHCPGVASYIYTAPAEAGKRRNCHAIECVPPVWARKWFIDFRQRRNPEEVNLKLSGTIHLSSWHHFCRAIICQIDANFGKRSIQFSISGTSGTNTHNLMTCQSFPFENWNKITRWFKDSTAGQAVRAM